MIGERIKQLRTDKGLSQQAFAELLSTSSGYICDVEKGKSVPGGTFLCSLKRVFGIDMNWLLVGEGEMKPPQPVAVAEKPEGFQPILLDVDRRRGLLHDKLQRVLDEGDKVKVEAVKGMLKAFDPGEKKTGPGLRRE